MNRHTYGRMTREWVGDQLRAMQSAPLLTEEEIANLLHWSAGYFDLQKCPGGGTMCSECEESLRLWWDLCNSLSGIVRIRLQSFMRDNGVPLPAHPGDDVDDLPTPRI